MSIGSMRRATTRSVQRLPGFIRGIVWIFQSIVSAAAMSVRIFLRKKLGERTLTLGLLVFAYVWVRYFMAEDIGFKGLETDFRFFGALNPVTDKPFITRGEDWDNILRFLYVSISYIGQFFQNIVKLWKSLFIVNSANASSLGIFFYSYLIVVLGLVHRGNAVKRDLTWEKWYSYSRGHSVFFGGLRDKVIRGRKITEEFIFIVIEPVCVFLLGLAVLYYWNDPNFSYFLMLSAGALFLEERREYQQKKEKTLNMIDGDLDGQRLMESYDKFGERPSEGFTTGAVIPD